ncbi:MAG: glycerol-3-phosphate acyltransferase [Anaerolineae bacterium]|nr:glycerol-3-phosphate acyltransferase [Anaerolineae bacterium]
MVTIVWTVVSFILGALPFSVWIGRLALKKDIRDYGDHNPGATNVARAGNLPLGVLAGTLDITKGALPVGLAWYSLGLDGWELVPIAVAPILGHAFSPFLNFKGGKAIAVSGGVWIGLLGLEGILVLLLFLIIWYALIAVDGWSVIFVLISLLIYLWFTGLTAPLATVWLGNLLIVGWKHREDLAQAPYVRSWLTKVVRTS